MLDTPKIGLTMQWACLTVHWRVQICHKSLSVVYDIKKRFLLIYLLTAWRTYTLMRCESEPHHRTI